MYENEDGNEDSQEEKKSEQPSRVFPSVLKYDLERATVPVELKDPKTGTVLNYTLQELDGLERDQYLNELANRMKVGKDGKPQGIRDFKDLQAKLVSRSLVNEKGENVLVAVIQKWPVHVQKGLFDTAQKLSALEEASEKDAKNE